MKLSLFALSIFLFVSYKVSYGIVSLSAQEIDPNLTKKWTRAQEERKGVIFFTKGSFRIADSHLGHLQSIAIYLLEHPKSLLYTRGHAWQEGTSQQMWNLSESRTKEIERFMEIHGVPERQIRSLFYGDTRPLQNLQLVGDVSLLRRVEYEIIEQ